MAEFERIQSKAACLQAGQDPAETNNAVLNPLEPVSARDAAENESSRRWRRASGTYAASASPPCAALISASTIVPNFWRSGIRKLLATDYT